MSDLVSICPVLCSCSVIIKMGARLKLGIKKYHSAYIAIFNKFVVIDSSVGLDKLIVDFTGVKFSRENFRISAYKDVAFSSINFQFWPVFF